MDWTFLMLMGISALSFIASILARKVKVLKIIFYFIAFYLGVFPVAHFLSLRKWGESLTFLILILTYIAIIMLRNAKSVRRKFPSVVAWIKEVIIEGSLGLVALIVGSFLYFAIPSFFVEEIEPLPKSEPVEQSLYFKNCTEAFSNGYSNIRRGKAGYRSGLDRDNDGLACER